MAAQRWLAARTGVAWPRYAAMRCYIPTKPAVATPHSRRRAPSTVRGGDRKTRSQLETPRRAFLRVGFPNRKPRRFQGAAWKVSSRDTGDDSTIRGPPAGSALDRVATRLRSNIVDCSFARRLPRRRRGSPCQARLSRSCSSSATMSTPTNLALAPAQDGSFDSGSGLRRPHRIAPSMPIRAGDHVASADGRFVRAARLGGGLGRSGGRPSRRPRNSAGDIVVPRRRLHWSACVELPHAPGALVVELASSSAFAHDGAAASGTGRVDRDAASTRRHDVLLRRKMLRTFVRRPATTRPSFDEAPTPAQSPGVVERCRVDAGMGGAVGAPSADRRCRLGTRPGTRASDQLYLPRLAPIFDI